MTYTHRMTQLPESYDTAAIEKKWQRTWLEQKTYAWDAAESRENSYVIDTPPPTVSGTLHMGHVFSYTQADFIARFQRMTGKNVFYPMGFDDNGLPTERLVEKTKKIRAADLSREDFIAQCLSVSAEARAEFRDFFNAIALSVDWAQEYHTISDDVRRLSQLSFLDLVENGHVYRALKPFYWDPVDQTAIAQAEIVDKELPSFQNIILFTIDGQPAPVMTTRPELIPACVALMCHPDDAAKYEGKKARTPLFNIEVPIIPDEKVDKEKGTGLVMCCTFGDDTDKEWWEKHKLETRIIINKYGKLLDADTLRAFSGSIGGDATVISTYYDQIAGKKLSNPDPKYPGAREIIIALLKEASLLTEQKPITHAVKTAERSGAPLEILPTQQWFVKVIDKKALLKEKSKTCDWHPEWMQLRMEQWIDGLNQDWCISRQRYFGVPFPVWYVKDADTTVAEVQSGEYQRTVVADASDLPINPVMQLPASLRSSRYEQLDHDAAGGVFALLDKETGHKLAVYADRDVMDTWATSSISPQISAHGISLTLCADTDRFGKLYPADLRPQAHEIIRTWAFYTLVKSLLHNASIPWKNLMISGWCLAEDKSKMSKSKGNVVTPVALIEEKGTDAVRYWAATSRLGQDTAFSPDLLKIGKKLVTKLWNATQFAAIHLNKLEAAPSQARGDNQIGETLDIWILSRLHATIAKATTAFAAYEYADALDATNQFFWADFCDNYLELVKKRVYDEDRSFGPAAQQSAARTLFYCLDAILKLYAPFVPHVTEELFAHIFADAHAKAGSLHARGQWPLAEHYPQDEKALTIGNAGVAILETIRKAKSERNVSIKFPLERVVIHPLTDDARKIDLSGLLRDLEGAGSIAHLLVTEEAGDGAPTPDGNFTLALTFAAGAQRA